MRLLAALIALSLISSCLPSCKQRGSAKGARLVGERVPRTLATIAKVDPKEVRFKVEDEPSRELWFVTAQTPGPKEWRCFFDRDAAFCDQGQGGIFADLVAHRRLGDNRGSIDDPTWILLLREAYGWASVYPEKDFLVPSEEWRKKLHIPHVERPKEGGLDIDVDVIEASGEIVTFHFAIRGEGGVAVRRVPIL